MDRVKALLGHSNIKVTEKRYSPWGRARQEQLEANVRSTSGPIVPGTKRGKPEMPEKEQAAI